MSWGLLLASVMAACGAGVDYRTFVPAPTPPHLAEGEAEFNANCLRCHGRFAAGTDSGPPLIHPMYASSHHADEAFVLAIRGGVSAHHWRFGNMPPQPQVPDSAVIAIREYVRWLQREAGLP